MVDEQVTIVPIPSATRLADETGKRFGKLVVIGYAGRQLPKPSSKQERTFWWCRCDCGNVSKVVGNKLRRGSVVSCGCYKNAMIGKASATHKRTGQPTHRSWVRMMSRCRNPRNNKFASYRGRGITVCKRWHSFAAFLEDMGERPSTKHSIDRIDPNGNYEPGNCRWATSREQNRNRRDNRLFTLHGETLCLAEWAERIGSHGTTITDRLARGWSIELALTTPPNLATKLPSPSRQQNSQPTGA